MKCQKCGFVSFDYLSECQKCGADLTAVRQRLGFSAAKAEVLFLLEGLLKDGGLGEIRKEKPAVQAEETGFGSDLGLDLQELSILGEGGDKLTLASDFDRDAQETAQDELSIELLEDDLEDLPEIEGIQVANKGLK